MGGGQMCVYFGRNERSKTCEINIWKQYALANCYLNTFQTDLLDMGIFIWSNYVLQDIDVKILGNIIVHFYNGWSYNLKK